MEDLFSWAEEEVPPPHTDDDAPPPFDDPSVDVEPWELTDAERRIYEAGFIAGYSLKSAAHDREVAQLNHEADRLYQEAFNRDRGRGRRWP